MDVQVAIWGGALVALLRDPPQQGPTELTESWLSISLQFEVVGNSSFKLHGIPPSLLRHPIKIDNRLTKKKKLRAAWARSDNLVVAPLVKGHSTLFTRQSLCA